MFAAELFVAVGALLPLQGGKDVEPPRVAIALVESDARLGHELEGAASRAVSAWNLEHPELRLVLHTLEPLGPWRGQGHALAELIRREQIAAVLGPAQDAEAHLVLQVATRLRIPVLSLSTAPSLFAAGDPWVFPAAPGHGEQAPDASRAEKLPRQPPGLAPSRARSLTAVVAEAVRAVGRAAVACGPSAVAIRRGLARSDRVEHTKQPSAVHVDPRVGVASLGSTGRRNREVVHAPPGGPEAPQESRDRAEQLTPRRQP